MDPNHLSVADSEPYQAALDQCEEHWGLVPERTQTVRDGVNHVFATETKDGAPVIVRISDGDARQRSEVLGEMTWLEHLIQQGCTVTTPIRSQADELVETVDLETGTYHACCFERFAGRQLNPITDPEWNDELFLKLGREIGRIHRASDDLHFPPGRHRKHWYESPLSQFPDPLPDCYDARVAERMQAFAEEMRQRPLRTGEYGLVHRDLHAGNFLFEQGRVEIIDFDLGCYGWRAMDFAVLLFGHYFYPSFRVPQASPEVIGHVLATLVRGYRDEHTLEQSQIEMVGDAIKIHEILNYVVIAPALEHWQIAMGNPHPTVIQSMNWLEQMWLTDAEREIDFSQIS